MIRRAITGTLVLAIVTMSVRAGAQATPLVRPDSRVYRDIERLGALGLIDTLILGARPYSEREVVRLLNEARANLQQRPAARAWAEPTIEANLARYSRLKPRAIDEATIELAQMSSPWRLAPGDANGQIDADINPLAAYREGRLLVDGTTLGLETSHAATLGRFAAIALSPRATIAAPRDSGTAADLRLMAGSVNLLFGDFAIEVGRGFATFGQAAPGGLLLSDNAPALDMIRVSNDRPWRVPLVSRLLGPMRGTLLVADLGRARQLHPHTKLIAYHVATLPHPQLELGFEVLDAMGGNGGQEATFWDRVLDVIPVVDAFRTSSDFQFSNKLAGVDLRWRMPRWAGFELYAEGVADDFDGRNLSRGFLADAAYIAGASVSCFIECGRFGLKAEYHQTGIRFYTHGEYPLTKNGFLLGDPLGPRGLGGYLTFDADVRNAGRLGVSAAFEARSGNTYRSATTGPNDAGFHFELVERRPSEKRGRLLVSWMGFERAHFSLQAALGGELVSDFAFVRGEDRTNGLARVAVVWRP